MLFSLKRRVGAFFSAAALAVVGISNTGAQKHIKRIFQIVRNSDKRQNRHDNSENCDEISLHITSLYRINFQFSIQNFSTKGGPAYGGQFFNFLSCRVLFRRNNYYKLSFLFDWIFEKIFQCLIWRPGKNFFVDFSQFTGNNGFSFGNILS